MGELAEREDAESWVPTDLERATLTKLSSTLLGFRYMARSGDDLRALGTAVRFIEWALDGDLPDDHAELIVGFRSADRSEGRWVGITFNEWAIELDETRSYYGGAGSDRETETHAVLRPGGSWNDQSLSSWLSALNEVLAHEGASFSGTLNE